MALNPEISLGIRPPQPVALPAIRSPLDRYQRMLTLRHLMTQGQLGQANLAQTQYENEALQRKAQGEQALTDLLRTTPNATTQQLVQAGGLYASPLIKQRLEAQKAALETEEATVKSLTSAAQGIAALPEDQQDFAYRAERARRIAANPGMAQLFPEQFQGKGWLDQQINAGLTAQQYYQKLRDEEKQTAELPGIKAKSFKDRINQLVTIGAAKLARSNATKVDEYTPWVAGLSEEEKPIFQDVTDPLTLQKRAQTPHEYVTAEQREIHDKRMADLTAAGHSQTRAKQMADQETALRQDFIATQKPFQFTADAYSAIQAVRKSDDPFKDLTYVFQFMKMLEPTSAVLGGEREDVEKRTGLLAWASNLKDSITKGQRLTPEQRSQIEKHADNLYKQRSADYNQRAEALRQTAIRQGLDPRNVTLDFSTTEPPKPPPPQSLVESVVNRANAPAAAQPSAQAAAAPDAVKSLLGKSKPGTYTLSDGSKWRKNADGTVTQAQ